MGNGLSDYRNSLKQKTEVRQANASGGGFRGLEGYRLGLKKAELEKTINFDTFATDINAMVDTVNKIYSGWQDADTMQNAKKSLSDINERIQAYSRYQKLFGGQDISDIADSYKKVLDDFDGLSTDYAVHSNSNEYNNSLANEAMTEAQTDGKIDLKDLVRAKKSENSGETPLYKNRSAYLKAYLPTPSAKYYNQVNSAIEKINKGKITVTEQNDLVEMLIKAGSDESLSQEERDYYNNLYNEFSDFVKMVNFNFEAGQKDIDYFKSELSGIENTEKLIEEIEQEKQGLYLAAAKGNKEALEKLDANNEKVKIYKEDLKKAYEAYGSKEELIATIKEYTDKYDNAKRLHEVLDAMKSPDFEEYSNEGAAKKTDYTIENLFLSQIADKSFYGSYYKPEEKHEFYKKLLL